MDAPRSPVPADALACATAIAATIDAAAPGLLSGLHLVGSAVLDDWRPPASDLDLVCVLARAPSPAERAGLMRALKGRPTKVEALWLTEADLVAPPADATVAVALRTLALYAGSVRGDLPKDLWSDQDRLAELLRENLAGYWTRWLGRARVSFGGMGLAMLGGWAPPWGVLGVARVAYTLETGDIASKTGAGLWALTEFPDHARVIAECLRLRTGEGAITYSNPFVRRRDALAAMADIMDAGRQAISVRMSGQT